MDTMASLNIDENFKSQLQSCAGKLVDRLQSNDISEASEIIQQLVDARNSHIFTAVGQLTRGLHDAIVNFQVDSEVERRAACAYPPEISDASDRLQYVIDITQKAANKTMDEVEAIAPIALKLGQESSKLKAEWLRLKKREITKEEFGELYFRVDNFLDEMGAGTSVLNNSLQEIIVEQGFQDLSGQVLNKVMDLIRKVEGELIGLIRIASEVESVTGLIEDTGVKAMSEKRESQGDGPQIHAEKREDVVSSQDEVDDLLSSLGF